MDDKIPASIIGLLSQIFPDRYSQAEVNALFLYAGVPDQIPDGSKATKIVSWLRNVNGVSESPLKVLGVILDDFMAKQEPASTFWLSSDEDHTAKLKAEQVRIRDALSREGLTFVAGGAILKGGALPTLSLEENVRKLGLVSVDIEIKRALSQIEHDPHAAAQYAGNVLEASLKAYLDHKGKAFGNGDTLTELWKSAAEQMGLRPQDWDSKDLKKIASGLNSIVDGIAHLRNNKSGAHGKSEEQTRNLQVKPRHARLSIHAAHTVATYVLELIE